MPRAGLPRILQASLLSFFGSACTGTTFVSTDFPETSGESLVLFAEDALAPQAYAFSASSLEGARAEFRLESSKEDFVIEALALSAPLWTYGLEDGPFTPLPADRGQPIFGWTDSFSATFVDGELGAWVSNEVPRPALSNLRVPGPRSLCPDVHHFADVRTDVDNDGRFVVPASPTSALVLFDNGVILLVRSDGTFDHVELVGDAPAKLASIAVDEAGALWAGSTALYRARLDGPQLDLREVEGSSVGVSLRDIAPGVDSEGDLEVFALDPDGLFQRFSGGRWEELHRFSEGSGELAVVRVGPGEAAATFPSSAEAAYFRDGQTKLETVGSAGLQTAGYVPNVGVLAASTGRIFVRAPEGGWSELEDNPLTTQGIRAIEPLSQAGAFMVGAGNGGVAISVGGSFCQQLRLTDVDGGTQVGPTLKLRRHFVNDIVELEDGTVILTGNQGSEPQVIQLLSLGF